MGSSRRSPGRKSRSGRHQRSPPSADDAHSRKKRRPGSSSSSSSDSESGSDTDQHVSSKKLQMSSSGKRSSDVRSSIKDDKRKKRRDTDSGSSSDDSESSPVKGKTAGSRGGESSRLRELISKRKTAVKNTHGSSSSESESESDAEDRSAAKRPDKKSSVSRTKQLDVRRPTSRKVSPRVSKADSRRKELRKSSSSDSSESESEDDVVPDYSRRKKERSLGRGSGRKGEVPSRNRDKESAPGVMSKSSKSSSSRLVRSEHDHRRRHSSERRNAPRPETTRHSGRREESGSRRRRDQSDSPEEHSSKRIVSRPQHREKLARSDGRREESGSRRRRDLSDSPEGQSPKGRSSRRQTKGSDSERKRDKVSTQARSSGSRGETGSKRRRDHAGSSEDASSKVRSSRRQNRGSGSERKREQASTQARSSGNRGESGSRRRKDSSDSSEGASPEGKSSRQNKGSDPDRKRDKASTQARSSGSRVESGSLRRRVPSYSSEDASPGGKSSRRQNKGSDSERKRDQTSTQARSSGSRGVSGLRRRKDLADSSEDAPPVGRSSHRKSKGSDSERKPDQGSTQACSSGGRIESGSRRRKDLSDTPEGQSSKRKNSRSRNQESGSDRKHGDTSERTLSKREQSHSRDRKEDDVREAKRDESVRDARGSDRPDKLKRDEEQLPSGKVKESSHRPQQGASRKRQSESSSSEDDSRRRRAAGSRKPSKSRHDGSEGRDKRTKDIMHKQKDAVASSKRTSTDDSTSEDESRRDAQSNTRSDRPRQVREPPSEGVKVAGRQQDTLKLRSASSSSSEVETPSAGKRGDRGGETEVSPSRTRPPVQKPVSPEVDPRGLRVLEEPADGVSSPSHRSTGTADGKKDANVEAVAGRQRHDTSESDSSSDVVGVRPAEMKKVTSAEESASDSGAAESHDEDAGIAGRKVDTVRSKVVVSGGSSGLPLPTADEGTEQKEEHGNATSKEEARKHRSPADGSEKGGGGSVSLTADRPKMRSEIGGRAAVVEDLRQKVGDAAEDEESTSGEDADIVSRSATPLSSPESPEVHHSTGNLGRETMRSTVVVNKPSGDKITGGFAGDGRSDKRRQHPDDGEDDAERRGSKRSGQNTADDSRGSRGRRPGDKKRTSSPGGGDSQKRQRGQRSSPDRQAYWSRAADSDEAAEQRDGGEGGRSPDHYWRREPFQRRPAEERYSDDLKRYAASQGDRKRRRSHEDGEERPRELRSSGAADKDVGVRAAADKTADTMPGGVSAAEMLTTRTGGAYIPPARLRMMQEQITDKSSAAYQRLAWEALKKSLNGLINKVNVSNLVIIVQELLQENVVRGRGLLCRALLQAQAASPTFTHVYAALVAVINTKFPQIGELLLHRLVLQFKRGFRRNDKPNCLAACRFVAHLVNQQVAHEVLALEILTLLLETPTDDSVEVSIGFLQEVGQKLTELSPRGVGAIFERLRHILHEAKLEKRVQYMIEVVFAVRKDGFKSYPSLIEELDVVEEDDQFTHLLALDEVTQSQEMLNVFRLDPDYEANEEKYATIRREVLDDSGGSDDGSGSEEDVSADEGGENDTAPIVDTTESNLLSLRKTIYLTIRSSLDFEETAHKLLKLKLKPGQEPELCHMFLDCCAQERTFEKFYGLLAERFCVLNRKYRDPMEQIFSDTYDTVHRLETSKLRNVAKLFGHLLNSDAISWGVLQHCRLNEEDTNSSSRIFIKILFQELSEFMGLARLNERVNDVHLGPAFEGLFPRDNPKNTRFAINFFTSIGLGGLTDGLRDHLKSQPKPTAVVAPTVGGAAASKDTSNNTSGISTSDVTAPAARRAGPPAASDSSSSSSSSSSSDSSSEPSESSSSDSESDGSERRRQKKKNKKKRSRKSKKSAQPRKKTKSDGKQEADRKEKSLSSRSKHDRPEKHRTNKSSSASRRR